MNIIKRRSRNAASQDDAIVCPHCTSHDHHQELYSDTVDFRGLELTVSGLQRSVCGKCSHIFESRQQNVQNGNATRAAYAVERDRLRERDGLLSSFEIESIRNNFHLGQRDAAVLFGGGPNAFNKYESGEVLQSIPMDRLLRLAREIGVPSVNILKSIVAERLPGLLIGQHPFPPIPDHLKVHFNNTVVHVTQSQSIVNVIGALQANTYKIVPPPVRNSSDLYFSTNIPISSPNITETYIEI